jgi:hypothetical protein
VFKRVLDISFEEVVPILSSINNKIPIEKSSIENLFLTQNFENWWWCGPFALANTFSLFGMNRQKRILE